MFFWHKNWHPKFFLTPQVFFDVKNWRPQVFFDTPSLFLTPQVFLEILFHPRILLPSRWKKCPGDAIMAMEFQKSEWDYKNRSESKRLKRQEKHVSLHPLHKEALYGCCFLSFFFFSPAEEEQSRGIFGGNFQTRARDSNKAAGP